MLRRELLKLIVAIIVLDSIAIPVFYIFHFNQDVGTRQQTFIGIWVLVSALVVAFQLRKIRRARMATIRGTFAPGSGRPGSRGASFPSDSPNDRQGPTAPGA